MNAAHPNATSSDPEARGQEPSRLHEPSMEEILASIRRIIADDQSLPDHAATFREPPVQRLVPESPMEATTPVEAPAGAVHVLRPEIAPEPPLRAPEPVAPPPAAVAPNLGPASPAPEPAGFETSSPHAGGFMTPQYPTPHVPDANPALAATHMTVPDPHPAMPRQPEAAPDESAPLFHAGVAEAAEPDVYDAPLGCEPRQPDPAPRPSLFSTATDHSVVSAFNVLAATRLADNSEELLAMTREMIRPILKEWLDDNLPSMVERLVRAEIERVSRGGR